MHTSIKTFSKHDSQKPQALISDLASVSVLAVLCLMISSVSGWR